MVPRRLLTVLLLLLVGLLIASAVAPPPEGDDDERASTTPTTTATAPATSTQERPSTGTAAVADAVSGRLPRDETVRAAPGETVTLTVTSGDAATIEIPALGAMQPAAPGAPAQFVVAFDAAGRYDVRDLEADESVGAVVVTE